MAENTFREPWQYAAAVLATVLVVSWGSYNYLYSPKIKEINRIQKDLRIMNQELMALTGGEVTEQKLGDIKKKMQDELYELSKKIPAEKETPYLINSFINQVGKGLKIDYNLIQPIGLVTENNYKRIPIRVEFDASYLAFNLYLEQLKELPAIIRVDNLDLVRARNQSRLSAKMNLSAFVVAGGTLPAQKKGEIDLSKIEDPFFKQTTVTSKTSGRTTIKTAPVLPDLEYSGFLEGKQRRAIINDITVSVGDLIYGYTVMSIAKDNVVLKKAGKLYTLRLK